VGIHGTYSMLRKHQNASANAGVIRDCLGGVKNQRVVMSMKFKDIIEMADVELNQKLADLKSELLNLRFQLEINQLDNPMRIKEVKKNIAQIKTVLREREIKNAN
jgi:large subunit ribosomal protein L29